MIDLDARAATEQVSDSSRRPWAVAFVACLVAVGLAGVLVGRPKVAPDAPGVRPLIRVTAVSNPGEVGVDLAAFIPTVTAWYADGTRGEASETLREGVGWRPDRPIRMLTVVAGVECAIQVDGDLVAVERAAINRVAVCVWTAPPV